MADKSIDDLVQASAINDDDLFVLQQSATAKKLKGSQLKAYAEHAADEKVEEAKQYAENASQSANSAATDAQQSAQNTETAVAAKNTAVAAATNAELAKNAIANMMVEAITLATGQPATVTKTLVDQVYKLTFGLPRGEKGEQGNTGATGNGILSITLKSGTHAPGSYDVYTITMTDDTTFDFSVYNGANGQGAGDMLAAVYDPQNKHQDVFAYADSVAKDKLNKTGDGSDVTATFMAATSRTNIATGEKLSVLFGKIAKWLADLGSLAFKSMVSKSDLSSGVQTSLDKADSAINITVTTNDNGKFLRVVNGVWAAASVPDANGVSF